MIVNSTHWSPYVNGEGKCISDIRFGIVDLAVKKKGGGIYDASDVVSAVEALRDKSMTTCFH